MGDPTALPSADEISTRPRCHVCQSVIVVDYVAADELWELALHPSWRNGYVCINCFASAADEKGIAWDRHIREVRLCSLAYKAAPVPFFHGDWEPVTAAERLRRLHGAMLAAEPIDPPPNHKEER